MVMKDDESSVNLRARETGELVTRITGFMCAKSQSLEPRPDTLHPTSTTPDKWRVTMVEAMFANVWSIWKGLFLGLPIGEPELAAALTGALALMALGWTLKKVMNYGAGN